MSPTKGKPAVQIKKKSLPFRERFLEMVGISSLHTHERRVLVALLAVSPGIIYLLEWLVVAYVLPTAVSSIGSLPRLEALHTEFAKLTPQDIAISAVLAVVLSFTCDRNTRATDAYLLRAWRRTWQLVLVPVWGHREHTDANDSHLDTTISTNTVDGAHSDKAHSPSPTGQPTKSHRRSYFGRLTALLAPVLSVGSTVPMFVRFVVTILLFGAAFRTVMGKVLEAAGVAGTAAMECAPLVYVIVVTAVVVWLSAIGVRYALRCRAARHRVVRVLASVVKSLLQARGRAYPVLYLYEEVAEILALGAHTNTIPTTGTTTGTPLASRAAVVHGASAMSFLGPTTATASNTSHPPATAPPTGSVSGLFGSPLGLSTSSKETLLRTSADEVHGTTCPTAAGAQDNVRVEEGSRNQDSHHVGIVRNITQEVMEGYSLSQVWKEVQKAVQVDTRIQSVELIVDGKKHTCWRLLTGKTQANV